MHAYCIYGDSVYGPKSPYTDSPYTGPYTEILGLNTDFTLSVYGGVIIFSMSKYGLFNQIRSFEVRIRRPYRAAYTAKKNDDRCS